MAYDKILPMPKGCRKIVYLDKDDKPIQVYHLALNSMEWEEENPNTGPSIEKVKELMGIKDKKRK